MSSSHIAVATILTRGAGLAIAKDFEDDNDAEVVICSWNRQRVLEAAKEISSKVDGAELYVTRISEAKQPLEEIMEGSLHSTILVNNSGYRFDSNTWYKIDDEMLYGTSENDEDQLRIEATTSAEIQVGADLESQKDLELAETEQHLPLEIQEKKRKGTLRTGFTTGTSATAATKAALIALLSQKTVKFVSVSLPKGGIMNIRIANTTKEQYSATSAVVKDAGDDPDVTDRAEVCATVYLTNEVGIISIDGGKGVGRVTKPGLGIDIGKPAINPSPTKMIERAVSEVAAERLKDHGVKVVISVPRGEEIAKKTDNPRLGIIGGISILGTTGIVYPYSTASFAASIRQALDVARAMGDQWIVLTTGGRSEDFAKELFGNALPEHCFVQMGTLLV